MKPWALSKTWEAIETRGLGAVLWGEPQKLGSREGAEDRDGHQGKQLNDKQCQIQVKNRTNQSKISLNFKIKRLLRFLSKVGSQNCDAGERQVTWEVENPLGLLVSVCLFVYFQNVTYVNMLNFSSWEIYLKAIALKRKSVLTRFY